MLLTMLRPGEAGVETGGGAARACGEFARKLQDVEKRSSIHVGR
jgi:hypothetical protein